MAEITILKLDDESAAQIAPENELERQLALIYCRLNTFHRPAIGEPMTAEERQWICKQTEERHTIYHAKYLASPGVVNFVWHLPRESWGNLWEGPS